MEWVRRVRLPSPKVVQCHRRACSLVSAVPRCQCPAVLLHLSNTAHAPLNLQLCRSRKSGLCYQSSKELGTILNSQMRMMTKTRVMISLTARFETTVSHDLAAENTMKNHMTMTRMATITTEINVVMDVAVILMTDQGRTETTNAGPTMSTVAAGGVLRLRDVAESRRGATVVRGKGREVGVVRETDVEVAAARQVLDIEVDGAGLQTDANVVEVRRLKNGSHSRNHHPLVEWTSLDQVIHLLNKYAQIPRVPLRQHNTLSCRAMSCRAHIPTFQHAHLQLLSFSSVNFQFDVDYLHAELLFFQH